MKVMIGRWNFAARRIFDQRLAIAFGVGAAEVAGGPLGEVLPFLVADEHHLGFAEVAKAGDDRLVVADGAVAVQLDELVEDQLDVVAGLGALGMARNADGLPGLEAAEDRPFQVGQLAAEPADLLGDPRRLPAGPALGVARFHLGQARFHLVDGRFEVETILVHAGHGRRRP